MGYYTRFTMVALDPTTHQPVDPITWPKSYFESIVTSVDSAYLRVKWEQPSGELFGGEAVKWYEYLTCMKDLSRAHPQFIWAIRGSGENPDDEWVLYAYRGTAYKEEQGPWVPPPPNMDRLPGVIRMVIPQDPPTPEEALRAVLHGGIHAADCPAYGSFGKCACPMSQVKDALKALDASRAAQAEVD